MSPLDRSRTMSY